MKSAPALPTVDFSLLTNLKDRMDAFTVEFDKFFIAGREQLRKEKNDFAAGMAEDSSQQKALIQAIEKTKIDQHELLEVMQNERAEVQEVRASISEYSKKQESLSGHKELLEGQISEVEEILAKKRAAMHIKRQELASQHAKNRPELQAWESQLGLRIETAGTDLLRFTFTRVDEKDPDRPCRMIVDVSGPDYDVTECSPSLPAMESMLTELNSSRDFSAFLKVTRQAFKSACRI
ncbi:chromosome segregation protein Spc25-domain-containing protein [Protomyces lactucae-debilis]|uniref:Kinetochore protein SPC25 n=1 Tax=Protomyces lactucae-debilis TaxID=2754530 RepID=A0A1Y2FV32_PROLT|nr:chromosome segregation protein Spc25-domain-containing protein [Protomyces lactucae-debilis]ORY87852.1 chromosome segregation protein Spc25-domain-containing protein [Protomyces lactucae-debilis]